MLQPDTTLGAGRRGALEIIPTASAKGSNCWAVIHGNVVIAEQLTEAAANALIETRKVVIIKLCRNGESKDSKDSKSEKFELAKHADSITP